MPEFLKGLAIGTVIVVRAGGPSRFATGGCRCLRWCRRRSVLVWAAGAARDRRHRARPVRALRGGDASSESAWTTASTWCTASRSAATRGRRPPSWRRSFWSPAAITLLGYGTLRQLVLSAAALNRPGLGGERRHARRRVGARPAGAADGEARSMNSRRAIPAFNEAGHHCRRDRRPSRDSSRILVVDDGSTMRPRPGARGRRRRARAWHQSRQRRAVRAGLARVLAGFHTRAAARRRHAAPPRRGAGCSTAAEPARAQIWCSASAVQPGGDAASRYHANRIGSRVLSWFVGCRWDTQCGFRVSGRRARGIPLHARGYDIETEMLVKIRRRGGRVASVPITAVYAGERSKLRPVRDTTRTCFLAVAIAQRG